MAITYRRDLDRKLTVLEMDTNFEELAKNIVIVPETPWWWLGGLQFRVRATQYPILNIAYSATLPEVDITLDVASAYLRNDIIFANIAGEVLKRTGDISGAVPDIIEETEYLIAIITVPAGATEPLAITAGDMYKENAEWTATKSPVTTRINLASTVLPFAGTYSIETSSPANKDTIILTAPAPVNVVDIALIKHRLKLKAALSQAAQIYVQFFNGANYVSSTLSLTVSKYGFLNTDTTNWQELIIPAADFTFSDTQVTGYRLMQRSSCLGWFLDDIVYQSGVVIPSNEPEYRLSPNVADKVQLLRNGISVSELDLNIISTAQQTALDLKLDASAYIQHFKGKFLTLAALVAANPTGEAGDYAQVNVVGAADVLNYNWDAEESVWVPNVDLTKIIIPASQVSDFDTEVGNNTIVAANTAKVTNVPTALSVGTVGINTVGITSDGGADDVIIPAATVSTAGLLTTAKWDEIVAKELLSNKKTDIEANKTSNVFYASIKSIVDWIVARYLPLTGGTLTGVLDGLSAVFTSTIQATTAKLTNLTDGYIPYHISDASGLGNSILYNSGSYMSIIKSQNSATYLLLDNINTGVSAHSQLRLVTDGGTSYIYRTSSNYSTAAQINKLTIQDDAGILFRVIGGLLPMSILPNGNILIATLTDDGVNKLQVIGSGKFASSVQVGDNTAVASVANVGALRYREDANNSYSDKCMKVSATTYAWVNLVTNTWV